MTPTEILTEYYGRAPTTFELALYNRLAEFLNRAPTNDEIGNMKSDVGLVNMVLADQM